MRNLKKHHLTNGDLEVQLLTKLCVIKWFYIENCVFIFLIIKIAVWWYKYCLYKGMVVMILHSIAVIKSCTSRSPFVKYFLRFLNSLFQSIFQYIPVVKWDCLYTILYRKLKDFLITDMLIQTMSRSAFLNKYCSHIKRFEHSIKERHGLSETDFFFSAVSTRW